MKTRKVGAIGILAATAFAMAPATPAQASATSVSGSLSCPYGQVVWVSVTTEYNASATFYYGTTAKYTDSGGYDHVYNYGLRSVNWRVDSTGNIRTVSDWCTGNVNSPSE